MSVLQTSISGSENNKVSPKRRWFVIVLVVALAASALVGGGIFIGNKITTSADNSSISVQILSNLQSSSSQRSQEIQALTNETNGLKKGNASVAKVFTLAYQAIQQIEAQDLAICAALPSCVPMKFIIPPAPSSP